jgi:hypothetical protein
MFLAIDNLSIPHNVNNGTERRGMIDDESLSVHVMLDTTNTHTMGFDVSGHDQR